MGWPTPQDYNEAIQNPDQCFSDAELRGGMVRLDALGLPRATTGAFACVYKMRAGDRDWAVRCFLNQTQEKHERYRTLSEFIVNDTLECTVPFSFLPQGIKVQGRWYPALKMEWVNGVTLDSFVRSNLENVDKLHALADEFQRMMEELRRYDVAHGDLQHGNIIVTDQGIRLVDYDGMYVPKLAGLKSYEVGHRNYQHPLRGPNDFGPQLDNFSSWVIYCSLRILAAEPAAMGRLLEEREGLIFSKEDFIDHRLSLNFRFLEQHEIPEVARHARLVRSMLERPCMQVPPLAAEHMSVDHLEDLMPLSKEEFGAIRSSMLVSKDAQITPELSRQLPALVKAAERELIQAPDWAVNEAPSEFLTQQATLRNAALDSDQSLKFRYRYLQQQWERIRRESSPLRAFAWQEVLAFVAIFMFASSIHLGSFSLIFAPLVAAVAVVAAIVYRWSYKQKVIRDRAKLLTDAGQTIDEGTSIIVEFHLVTFRPKREIDRYFEREEREKFINAPPHVQLKDQRCPMELVAAYMPVRNWNSLTKEEQQSISWQRDQPESGYLIFNRLNWEPIVLVTDRNVPLWFL